MAQKLIEYRVSRSGHEAMKIVDKKYMLSVRKFLSTTSILSYTENKISIVEAFNDEVSTSCIEKKFLDAYNEAMHIINITKEI
jgi:hypothetical protein